MLIISCLFYYSHLNWLSHFVLTCIFLMISDVEHLSACQLAICMSCLEKYLFQSPAHFLIVLFGFWILSYMSYLYILDINLLSDILFANIFSHLASCLFILLVLSLTVKKFNISLFPIYFCFFPLPEETYFKKLSFHNLCHL